MRRWEPILVYTFWLLALLFLVVGPHLTWGWLFACLFAITEVLGVIVYLLLMYRCWHR